MWILYSAIICEISIYGIKQLIEMLKFECDYNFIVRVNLSTLLSARYLNSYSDHGFAYD